MMDGAYRVEEIDSPLQRVTHRRRAFFMVPIAATSVAGVVVAWEILRQNLPADMIEHWPWRLKLLDLESGATVLTVLALFLFTRAQYAETIRPVIGWGLLRAIPGRGYHSLRDQDGVLEIAIYNGGGMATIISLEYRLARNEDAAPSPWVSYDGLHEHMARAGLVSHEDYDFILIRAGFPLHASVNKESAPIVEHIRLDALLKFRVFDIKVEVRDAVGDTHERILPCRAVLRDPATLVGTTARGERPRMTLHRAALQTLRTWRASGRSQR